MTIPENGSGVYCLKCDTDLGAYPDHMCGSDPIVMADEDCLEPFLEWMGAVIPGRFRCKYCYSGVGRQHYECPKATETKISWTSYYWRRRYLLSWRLKSIVRKLSRSH